LSLAESALIDEYVLGALPPDDAAAFEQHFLAHPERQEQLRLARALHAYAQEQVAVTEAVKPPTVRPARDWFAWLFAPPVRAAALAVLLLAVGIGVWRVFLRRPDDVDLGLADLNAAYAQECPFEPRITGLACPPPRATRGPGDEAKVDALARDSAQATLLRALRERPQDLRALHAAARAYLAQKKFDDAIKQLEAALKLDPDNAQLHADLGAALLAQAETYDDKDGQKLEFRARSLEHLKKAVERDGDLLAARFNFALCLQQMTLTYQARQAWQEYLQRDANSEWANRARSYLKQLDDQQSSIPTPEQTLNEFLAAYRRGDDQQAWRILSQTREMITGRAVSFQLARQYLKAAATNRQDEAKQLLAALSYAGELEKENGHDPFVADLAAFYGQALTEEYATLLEAQDEMAAGYALSIKGNHDAALENWQRAQAAFSRAKNVNEAKVAQFWVAYGLSQADRLQESIKLLQEIASFSQAKNYKWLASHALCWIGDSYTLSNESSKSIAIQNQALELAEAAADSFNQQKLLTQLGFLYAKLGQPRRALAYHQASLALAGETPFSFRQRWRNFTNASGTFFRLKLYQSAAAFEEEALQLTLHRLNSPMTAYSAHLHLASIYVALKRFDSARQQAELSLRVAEAFQEQKVSRQMTARARTALGGALYQTADYAAAAQQYDQAVEIYDRLEFSLDKYEAHKGKLACSLANGDQTATQAQVTYLLDLFEQNRDRIKEAQNRDSFFGAEQSVYDLAVDFYYRRQDYQQAFVSTEQARGRSLLDALHEGVTIAERRGALNSMLASVTQPLKPAEIQSRMPSEVQIVQYSALPDKLLIWFITKTRFEVSVSQVSQEELDVKVSDYLAAVKASANGDSAAGKETRRLAAELYNFLIQPLAGRLEAAKDVCFIPDGELARLPFAALVSPSGESYLVAAYRIFYAPSASALVLISESAQRRRNASSEHLLAVGNPAFDRHAHADLPDLPTAASEVREIAANYRTHNVLSGGQAQKGFIRAEMARSGVIHFACHYLIDEAAPLRSRLLLAKGGDLEVYEVLQSNLSHARLVTLAACQTNAEQDREGLAGLSRAFLAAGAPLVVASQWPVESEATTQLMKKFHFYRAGQGLSSNEALRRAQLEMINATDGSYRQPYYWAAFLPLGGYTAF
jgi:CHAT domain-containing protein